MWRFLRTCCWNEEKKWRESIKKQD